MYMEFIFFLNIRPPLRSTRTNTTCPYTTLFRSRYAFSSRFGDEKGTNPEELIAAAHAGCFTMALSAKLTEAGHPPTRLDTPAAVDLSMEGGPSLSRSEEPTSELQSLIRSSYAVFCLNKKNSLKSKCTTCL